ncbi:MAG: GNAT family N-acetyltransferase [Aeromicrobium sp.]
MTTIVQDNPTDSRFEIIVDGELAGFVDYRQEGGAYALPHTRIYPRFEGRGLGGQLISGALTEIAARGGSVLPYCPFVPKVIRDHPEFLALVPEARRGAFGL